MREKRLVKKLHLQSSNQFNFILYPLNKLLPKWVMYLSDFIDNIHNVDYLRETLW